MSRFRVDLILICLLCWQILPSWTARLPAQELANALPQAPTPSDQLELVPVESLSTEGPPAADSKAELLPAEITDAPSPQQSVAEREAAEQLDAEKVPTNRFLDMLRRPVREIKVTSLSESAVPGRMSDDPKPVSQQRSTDSAPRWISSGGDRSGQLFAQTTSYPRRRLYFEDAPLERCGVSGGWLPTGVWTNARSATKFVVEIVLWPYQLCKQPPDEPVSATAR